MQSSFPKNSTKCSPKISSYFATNLYLCKCPRKMFLLPGVFKLHVSSWITKYTYIYILLSVLCLFSFKYFSRKCLCFSSINQKIKILTTNIKYVTLIDIWFFEYSILFYFSVSSIHLIIQQYLLNICSIITLFKNCGSLDALVEFTF